jgi:hypothetical protein
VPRARIRGDREIDLRVALREHERPLDDVGGVRTRRGRDEQHRHRDSHAATLTCLVLGLAACQAPDLEDLDTIFYAGGARDVHCAANLDEVANNPTERILAALDRAAARNETVEFYAHAPGRTLSLERLDLVLSHANALGLRFITYSELATNEATGPAIALGFDDHNIAEWSAIRPTLTAAHARVTFFVSEYAMLDAGSRAEVRALADDGHDIEPHSVHHLRAPVYVEEHGLSTYMKDEVLPSIDLLVADGYPVTTFAYPFGARTSEIDRAILKHVQLLRAVDFPYRSSVQSTCPL